MSAIDATGRRILHLCLFLSGGAALVLEVAWSRALSLSLGNSHQAVATVVASMMTGLCLGSVAAARLLPWLRRAALAYGLVEIAIGAYAALTPVVFKAVPAILAPIYGIPGPAFSTIRFLLVFLILLPASSGMGATLPLVTAALAERVGRGTQPGPGAGARPGSVVGRLYGLNTLGAFSGTLAGGFLLLPLIGLARSTIAGAATSLLAGGLAFLFTRGAIRPEREEFGETGTPAAATGGGTWILPLYAISGGLAMVYEITWTRALAPIVGTSVYSFTLILAAVLAGIGIGSLVLSALPSRRLDPARAFVVGQILLAVTAFLSTWWLGAFPDLVESVAVQHAAQPGAYFLLQFLLFVLVVLLPGLVLGALFPIAARLVPRIESETGAGVGRIYAWNTAGAIIGALAAGFVLVEALGSERTLVLASAASALVGLAAVPFAARGRFAVLAGALAAGLAIGMPLLVPSWDLYRMTSGITQILRNQGREDASGPGAPASAETPRVVFHREGRTSTVTVVKDGLDAMLRVDGKSDASTADVDMAVQVLLGQLPFLFVAHPRDACVIGFGSGVTSHAVLTHPVRRLDNIEIERQVIAAARFFEKVNFDPLADPRSRLIVDDARTTLLYRPQTYDVIISEPSNPWMAGVNNLFTTEFYALVRRRLNRGGVFCQWVQHYEMSSESLQTMFDTLAASFPNTHLFVSQSDVDLLLVASEQPLSLAPGAGQLFPDRPGVARDLARVNIKSLPDLAILYSTPLPPPPPGKILNNDDNSLIQYRAPLDMLRGAAPSRMLFRASPPALLSIFFPGLGEAEALLELGHAAQRREALETVEAIAALLKQEGHPAETKGVQDLAADLRRRLQDRGRVNALLQEAEAHVEKLDVTGAGAALLQAEAIGLDGPDQFSRAGFVLLKTGRYADAEKHFERMVSAASSRFVYQGLAGRGAARIGLGRRREGMDDIAAAKAIDPDHSLAYALLALSLLDAGERDAALAEARAGLRGTPTDVLLQRTLQVVLSAPLFQAPQPSAPPPFAPATAAPAAPPPAERSPGGS